MGNYDESLEISDLAIEIDSGKAYGYVLKADALQALGHFEDGIENYEIAIKLVPESDYAYGELSMAYLSINNTDSALQSLECAIEINPENEDYFQDESWVFLAREDYSSAYESILRAIEINPENDQNYAVQAHILMLLGKLDNAQFVVNTALEINSNNAFAYDVNGMIAMKNKDFSTTFENFNISLEMFPNDENTQFLKNQALNGLTESLETSNVSGNSGGGCLIATATYDSELTPQVQQLRELRDNTLLQTESGTLFMTQFNDFYYSFSPIIADYERENPIFKEMVKITITPMITSLSILNYVDIYSENKVLGYGISLLILNGLMYVGIPMILVVGIRKKFKFQNA